MKSIKSIIHTLFKNAIKTAYELDADPLIQYATRPEFGDFQANFALSLSKSLKLNPKDIAEQVIALLLAEPLFSHLEISGPGFINIRVANNYLSAYLLNLLKDKRLGIETVDLPQTIVVDYGGANVAKEMHVGHLRSAIIGDSFVRLLQFKGHDVIRQNHLGDWGTQFGMLIECLLQAGWQANSTQDYSDLNALYKQSKQRFDEDTVFAEQARKRVVALQSGDPTSLKIWQQLVDKSQLHFQKVYDQLGVLLNPDDNAGESLYNDMLTPMVNQLLKTGLARIDQDAVIIDIEGFVNPEGKPVPFMVRKQDGGYLYATTDLAAIQYRVFHLQAQHIIYVVDARQKQHFEMLFAAAKKALNLPTSIQLEHTAYGAVLGDNHKPLKTRSGVSIKLSDLLQEAEKRAADIITQKHPNLTPDELNTMARKVGIGALKYADLRSDKIKDYVFNWDKMLAFEGNTGPYLQNAYVRILAIFRKGQIDLDHLAVDHIELDTPQEHRLAIKLSAFNDVVTQVAVSLQLHVLCEYLYDLASIFHHFYEHCPILSHNDDKLKQSRLGLCALTAHTLRLGLNLLGIDVLEKM